MAGRIDVLTGIIKLQAELDNKVRKRQMPGQQLRSGNNLSNFIGSKANVNIGIKPSHIISFKLDQSDNLHLPITNFY